MNRDNLLFLVIGVLCGFIAGYMIQERMASVQPLPRIHGETGDQAAAREAQRSAQTNASPGAPAAGAPMGGGPPMAAVQELRQRVEANPQDAEAILQLANLNFDISNWSRAQELFDRYLTLNPGEPDVLSDLGICFRALGQHQEAIEAFDEALEAAPDHWYARFNKAIVLGIDMGNLDAADEVVAELRQQRPDAPELERLTAELERRRG